MASGLDQLKQEHERKIKCVIWDLDNTIWDGTLLEDASVQLRHDVIEVIKRLDERGILHSIASRNDHEAAMRKLVEFGIHEYFIYPQINWGNKSDSIQSIVKSINIGMDSIAFVDDQPFERDEVNFHHPAVMCFDAAQTSTLIGMSEFIPITLTEDAKNRRLMYMQDIVRKQEEEEFSGSQEEFLSSLRMVLKVTPVQEGDLRRAEELTVRTHQLNATGYMYSYEELDEFRLSKRHKLLISELEDKYGTYGKIGLALLECGETVWTLKLMLMSCRVISRGVGSLMLSYIAGMAKHMGVKLRAEFVPTNHNRMMLVTFKFAGFVQIEHQNGVIVFEQDPSHIQRLPEYMTLISCV